MSMSEPADASLHRSGKRVLVTGATGFLGSHLAHALIAEGHAVTALARGSKSVSARDRVVEALSKVAGNGTTSHGIGAALERLRERWKSE